MSNEINVCVFSGNLGGNATIRPFANGNGAVSFSIAYTESWLNAEGARTEVTHWLECEKIGKEKFLAYAEKYLLKGQQVVLKGKAINKEWTSQDGVNHRKTVFSLESIQLVGEIKGKSADSGQQAAPAARQAAPAARQAAPAQAQSRPYAAAADAPSYSYQDEDDITY